MSDRPNTLEDYVQWLRKDHGIEISKRIRTHFEAVIDKVKKDFRESPFWMAFTRQLKLRDYDEQYKLAHDNYPLVTTHEPPELSVKSFDSFLQKNVSP